MTAPAAPLALLAELTHRCPLRCPYCSNPLALEPASRELDVQVWKRVCDEAVAMGIHQVHFSGGEPTVYKGLEQLIQHAAGLGLYPTLITSGVLLNEARIDRLAELGLEHVQISFQDCDPAEADRFANFKGVQDKKIEIARLVRKAGLPLTINAVMHRQNLPRLEKMIDMAVALDAHRLEVAQVQYYGWAFANRAALVPTYEQLLQATRVVDDARERLKGVLVIDYVIPDYYARRPKVCFGGWARKFIVVNPAGKALPCHAAETIPVLRFDTVQDHDLSWIWEHSESFNRFRGTEWMTEPCRSCERRALDWGGCRCQAFALTGDAANADPACALSPHHKRIFELATQESAAEPPPFIYRGDTL